MSGFRFTLQRLLDLRRAVEQAQAAVHGKAAAEEARRKADTDSRASDLQSVEEQASGATPVPAGLRHVWGLSTEAARARLAEADDALREAREIREREQDRLSDALMARRSLERLREKHEANWTVDNGRREQAESDESARQRNSHEERE